MRKPLWTYLACCIAVFMISMDNLIVTNALPVIRQALHTGLEGRPGRPRVGHRLRENAVRRAATARSGCLQDR